MPGPSADQISSGNLTNNSNSTGMDPSTISSLIGVGGSLLGDIFNLFGSSKANREQRSFAMNVMNQQREWSLEDLKNQQEYNSPVQQMQRLKDAKLNPNLVYGTGIQAAGQSEQPRAVASANFSPQNELAGFQNLGSQVMEAQNLGVSLEKIKADTTNVAVDTIIKRLTPGATEDKDAEAIGFNFWHQYSNNLSVADNVTENNRIDSAVMSAAEKGRLDAAARVGLNSLIDTEKNAQVRDNLKAIGKNLAEQLKLLKLDEQSQTWDFNANSPVWQQAIQKLMQFFLGLAHHKLTGTTE